MKNIKNINKKRKRYFNNTFISYNCIFKGYDAYKYCTINYFSKLMYHSQRKLGIIYCLYKARKKKKILKKSIFFLYGQELKKKNS